MDFYVDLPKAGSIVRKIYSIKYINIVYKKEIK